MPIIVIALFFTPRAPAGKSRFATSGNYAGILKKPGARLG